MGSIDELNIEKLKDLSLNGSSNGVNGTQVQELDALIVGAGFGGVYQLKTLRDAGYKVKLVECGTDYGGVWYWNRYPGARVDSSIPHYEFSDPALWKDWEWKQRFPDHAELRAYFAHVAKKWDLRKDTQFNTFVSSATWNDATSRWTVKTKVRAPGNEPSNAIDQLTISSQSTGRRDLCSQILSPKHWLRGKEVYSGLARNRLIRRYLSQ